MNSSSTQNRREAIAIAGAGRVGQALGRLLARGGEHVAAVWSRNPENAVRAASFIGGGAQAVELSALPQCAGRILITVPDGVIEPVARALAESRDHVEAALHTSGALDSGALRPLAFRGTACGSLHPLQTVASPEQGVRDLPGSLFAVEGEVAAISWAEAIIERVGGERLLLAPGAKPLYHAAAVLAGNAVTGLVAAAVELLRKAGISESLALRAIGPLLRASAENALSMGPAAALTGPVERGDTATVALHLEAQRENLPERELYRAVSLYLIGLARRKRGELDRWDQMQQVLAERRHDG